LDGRSLEVPGHKTDRAGLRAGNLGDLSLASVSKKWSR
jgi:hypothetical protein